MTSKILVGRKTSEVVENKGESSFGEAQAPARVTTREVPEKNIRKVRINIMLDEDIIEYFKQQAAFPNAAPYQTQINQALRQIISGKRLSALPFDDQNETLAERIAEKVASRLRRVEKKKAA